MLLMSMSQNSVCDATTEFIDVVIPASRKGDEFRADD